MTCLYCPSDGPYTVEHVVPAGMGGDDNEWMLKDLVCGHCNSDIFSPLEAKLMRASPVAVARLLLQPNTRSRGSRTGTPSLDSSFTYSDDVEHGVLIEHEFRLGGEAFTLPQVLFQPPNQLKVTANDAEGAQSLLKALDAMDGVLILVEKVRELSKTSFYATTFQWRNLRYEQIARIGHSKPPRDAVFLEPLAVPGTPTNSVPTPRVFQRSRGGLVCRAADVQQAAQFLTVVRLNRAALTIPDDFEVRTTENPTWHVGHVFDTDSIYRAHVKIAVNLCARLFGAEAVRGPAFANARENARYGTAKVRRVRIDIMEQFGEQFPPFPHHHLLIVYAAPADEEYPAGILVTLRLYGVVVDMIVVAEGPRLPICSEPIFVVVDYLANRIERMSFEQFQAFALEQWAP